MSGDGSPERRAARILVPTALFATALAIRAVSWRAVHLDGHVNLFGNDSFYHLRRIVYTVRNFPDFLLFDHYINHPHGAAPIWTPLFDFAAALLVWPFAKSLDPDDVGRVAVWIPPLLGAATVVALYGLARRHFGRPCAVLAAALLCVSSAHFWYSQLGFVDHHAAVALGSTGLLAAGMGFLERPGARTALAVGAAQALVLWIWPGGVLFVAIVVAGAAAALLAEPERERAAAAARAFALAQVVSLAAMVPGAVGAGSPPWSAWTPVVLSRFQPWLFAVLALWGVACAALWRRTPAGSGRAARAASAAGLALILLASSAVLWPELAAGVADAWRWLDRRESFQAGVAESQPLFLDRGRWSSGAARERLSDFVFVFPTALAWLALRTAYERSAARGLLVGWTAVLFAVTILQRRFFNSFSVVYSLVMAWTFLQLAARVPARWIATPVRRAGAAAIAAASLVLLLQPSLRTYGQHLRNLVAGGGGETLIDVTPSFAHGAAAVGMARWIRDHTPETSGWLDRRVRPEYGILAPWGVGHVLEYVARRPTVTDNFGDDIGSENFELARRYFRSPESEGVRLLDTLGARYVIAQGTAAFIGGSPADPDALFHALYERDGSEAEEDGALRPALAQHRLLFESSGVRRRKVWTPSVYKVFEYVPGARVRGRAPPGSIVRASLALRTNRKREIEYRTRTTADAEGRYRLHLPHATGHETRAVSTAEAYAIEAGGRRAELRVSEEAVTGGLEVAGPDLRAPVL